MKIPMLVVLLAFLWTGALAQEDCGEVGDENDNQLWDCADPACACTSTFPCHEHSIFYQIRDANRMWTRDLDTDWAEMSDWNGGAECPETNAIGYNAHDGYIYGMRTSPATPENWNNVVRIGPGPGGGSGSWYGLTVAPYYEVRNGPGDILMAPGGTTDDPFPAKIVIGDMDLDGNMYITYPETPNSPNPNIPGAEHFWVIDMDAYLAGTFPQWSEVAFDFTTNSTGLSSVPIADWAFLPETGMLYGAASGGDRIIEVDPGTGEVTVIPIATGYTMAGSGGFGAAFADNASPPHLYFFNNSNGRFYQCTADAAWDAATEYTVVEVAGTADPMSLNDGASCSLATNPTHCPCEECWDSECCERRVEMELEALQAEIAALKRALGAAGTAVLHQNDPNPFDATTAIAYEIHDPQARKASISIFNTSGVLMRTYAVGVQASGVLNITGNTLAPGVYTYTLIVDDKEIDTKRMILLE